MLQEASVANPDVAFLGIDHQDSRRAALEMLREAGVTAAQGYRIDGATLGTRARRLKRRVAEIVDVAAYRLGLQRIGKRGAEDVIR